MTMTFTPARIEAAARAMADQFGFDWDFMSDEWRGDYEDIASMVLACAYPDLASGEAWVAPREATEGMAFSTGSVTPSEANVVWQSMRDAHLAEQPDTPPAVKVLTMSEAPYTVVRTQVATYRETATHQGCGGALVFNGIVKTSFPPWYVHVCDRCGEKVDIHDASFPGTVTVPVEEGEV